jgi:hypothetical protein
MTKAAVPPVSEVGHGPRDESVTPWSLWSEGVIFAQLGRPRPVLA